MGQLVPILCQPVVPGDRWTVNHSYLLRFNPLIAPLMHRVDVFFHSFFVPNRIIWDGWEEFITGGKDGNSDIKLPKCSVGEIAAWLDSLNPSSSQKLFDRVGSLPDYLGLPVDCLSTQDSVTPISLLPFRAYQLIYNEFYRDETLEDEIEIHKDWDGDKVMTSTYQNSLFTLRNRAWKKDYFSGSLPWPQRRAGDEVRLPISGTGTVGLSDPSLKGLFLDGNNQVGSLLSPARALPANQQRIYAGSLTIDNDGYLRAPATNVGDTPRNPIAIDLNKYISPAQIQKLKVDITNGSSVTINQLREALRLQQWLENNARGGSRYVESLLSHFGVRSSDARLQRPEYLGGYTNQCNFTEVLQQSETDKTPLGKQGGHGFAVNSGKTIKRKYFEEHGYLFTIMSVRPQPMYMQGIPRDFMKTDALDFYWPEFQHLGEQPVYTEELYNSESQPSLDPKQVFGYVPRYSEYKFIPSTVHGDFRTTMNYYHLARKFANMPYLNADFIKCDEKLDGMDRIFATLQDDETNRPYQHLWFQIQNNCVARRKMSYYGVPTLI